MTQRRLARWAGVTQGSHMERASYEFHIGRAARDRFGFSDRLFSVTANVGLPRSRKTADSPP